MKDSRRAVIIIKCQFPDNRRGRIVFEGTRRNGTKRRAWREFEAERGRRLNGRAMFERGLKRHSYQLWEVKFQCPAKESAAETEQRLSSQLARYILPSRGPSYPLPPQAAPT